MKQAFAAPTHRWRATPQLPSRSTVHRQGSARPRENLAGPIATLVGAQTPRGVEQGLGGLSITDCQVRHRALTRFGCGDPRSVSDATDSEALHQEGVESGAKTLYCGITADGTTKHRVVPIHGPSTFRRKGPFGFVAHDVAESLNFVNPVSSVHADFTAGR